MRKSIFCTHLCLLAVSAAFSQGTPNVDSNGTIISSTSEDGVKEDSTVIDRQTAKTEAGAAPAVAREFGEGLFQPYTARTTGSWPEAIEIADVNSDGLKDVVMVTSYYFDPTNDHKLFVYLQNTSGGLDAPAKYPAVTRTESVDVGDFNNDGRTDIVVGGQDTLGVFYQNSGGTMNSLAPLSVGETRYCKAGDFNNDGLDDIVSANHGSGSIKVLLQNPSGGFLPQVSHSVGHGGFDELEVGDLNNDNLDDVIVMSGQSYAYDNFAVLLQNSSGTLNAPNYYDLPITVNASGIGIGDMNGDDLNDVVLAYGGNKPASNIALFFQNGSGTLNTTPATYPSYDIPEPVEVADVDRDGRDDVLTLHGGWNAMGVYAQSETGLYPEVRYSIPYASHYNPQGFAIGDINRDGGPDVAIADYNQGLVILYHVPVHTAAEDTWGLYQ